jgi:dTDP-4-amino-4,6-dideoxygalactose transaminase
MEMRMDTLNKIPIAAPQIGAEEKSAVMAVLDSGQLAQGPVTAEFERAFAAWCGVRNAIAVSSGTAALHALMLAHGLKGGDEVITTPFTFAASANAALFVGARPVFVDVEAETACLDPNLVEAAVTSRTRAIVAVDLYGHPAAINELKSIADRHGLALIEDACQAHGATVGGRKTGALGVSAAFSFYPTKNMTTGEGGMVTTDDDKLAARLRPLREHGARERYKHDVLGYNLRLTDIASAIGLAQLAKLDAFNQARRRNAKRLTEALAGQDGITLPFERPGNTHVYHQYTVRIHRNRDGVQHRLAQLGVGSAVHYPTCVHRQPFYVSLGYGSMELPVAETLADEVLSIPVHPALSDSDLDRVSASLIEAVKRG